MATVSRGNTQAMGATYMGPAQGNATATNVQQTSVQNTNTTTRKYIDVPTPEEFLDDFQNAFAGHLQAAVQSGGLSNQAALWAMTHASQFLDRYTGKLAQMAAAGQQIFRANLPPGQPTYLGTRQGNVSSTQGTDNTTRNSQTNPTQPAVGGAAGAVAIGGGANPGPAVPFQMDTSGGQTQGNAGPAGLQAARTPGAGATNNPSGPAHPGATPIGPGAVAIGGGTPSSAFTNTNTQQYGTDTQTENIYSQPQAGTLHTYSPTQFMQDSLSPDSMSILYEGQKGESQYARDKVQRQASGTRMLTQ